MRTDQTRLCARCALRFSRKRSCPSCAARGFDLRGALDRQVAIEKLRRPAKWRLPSPSSGCVVAFFLTSVIVLTFAIGFGLAFVFHSPALALAAYFVVPVVCTLLWGLAFPDAHLRAEPSDPPHRYASVEVHPIPLDDGEPAVVGEVVANETLTSPLSGTVCVAFRLVGRSGPMEIDDAGLVPFEVNGDAGAALVDSEDGCVAIEPGDPVPVEPNAALTSFLTARGVIEGQQIDLAEAVLRPGDRVAVSGARSERDRGRGDGYRGTESIVVLRDEPDLPVVIRAVSDPASPSSPS